MQFADAPRYIPPAVYDRVLDQVARRIGDEPGSLAVYQVGGVGTPGVSDLDLYAVFEDGAQTSLDPRQNLDADGSYLVTHGQFGLVRSHFIAAAPFGFFHNFRLLAGRDVATDFTPMPDTDLKLVKRQEGLEYLVKMWMWLSIARTYRLVRLRSLMLLVKGLLYDLQYVGVMSGPLVTAIHQMLAWRQSWFESRPSDADLEGWIFAFARDLEDLLRVQLKESALQVPEWASLRLARNIELVASETLEVRHTGVRLPRLITSRGRKGYNLQHRFNRFRFHLPISRTSIPASVGRRHDLIREMVAYNRRNLPNFTPVSYGLPVYGIDSQ